MGPHLDVAPINHTRPPPLLPPPAPSRHSRRRRRRLRVRETMALKTTSPFPTPKVPSLGLPSSPAGARSHRVFMASALRPNSMLVLPPPHLLFLFRSVMGFFLVPRQSVLAVVAENGAGCGNCVDLGSVSVGGRFCYFNFILLLIDWTSRS